MSAKPNRLIASRRLKRTCIYCNGRIEKGRIYYRQRTVIDEDGEIFASEYVFCARCNFKGQDRKIRYARFQETCVHPDKFIETVWSYIPGEAIKEPHHSVCILCGAWV